MSSFIDLIIDRARKLNKTICLPEGDDPRVKAAAKIIEEKGIANVVILGEETPNEINDLKPDLAQKLFELRKKRGMKEQI